MPENESTKKISLMIEPTNRCNLRCITCFSHQDGRPKKDMSLEEFMHIIDGNIAFIRSLSLYNYGEPLLNREIFRMIQYAKMRGIGFVKVATNGMALDKGNIHRLLDSGLDRVSISVDGACEDTYSEFRRGGNFDIVVDNIRELVKSRNRLGSQMEIEMQFIIMRHNEHEIDDIRRFADELGVDILRYKTVLIKERRWDSLLPVDSSYSRYNQLSHLHSGSHDNTCRKPFDEMVINSDGTAIPCCYIVGDDILRYAFGNIMEKSIAEIMESERYKAFVGNCLSDKDNNSCCRGCNEGCLSLDYEVVDLNGRKD